jgi:tetratricopeptide (TPR) repeat protein
MDKITNPHRRKQIEEFVDDNHPSVMSEYYDVLDRDLSPIRLKKVMNKLIKKDPLFFDPYLILADILYSENKPEEARELLSNAYVRAVKRIADKDGNWPKRMEWGWLENRHIMRFIVRYAYLCWEEGGTEEALDIFRNLLRANPDDNQGVRYAILAIKLGLGPDWDDEFLVTKGPMAGEALDARKVMDWFEKHARRFPEEFDWLFQEWKRRGYD